MAPTDGFEEHRLAPIPASATRSVLRAGRANGGKTSSVRQTEP